MPSSSEHQSPSPTGTESVGPQGDGAAGELEALDASEVAMSFLDHLEEFRWTLIKGFGAVLTAIVVCAFFSEWIIDQVLLGPTYEGFFMYRLIGIDAQNIVLQNRTITGQFFAHVGAIAAVGVVIGSPLFVYFMWKFVEPGLYKEEKQGLRFAAAGASFFFALGIAFGYLIITPLALQFFQGYVISEQITNEFDISKYFSMVTFWAFGVGLLFELPVVVYFLARIGLATPEVLRAYRKYALIVVLIAGAFFTPPDPLSQVLVALPLLLLYEASIYVAAFAIRKRKLELKKAWGEEEGSG